MSLDPKSLSRLFDLCPDAVLGVDGGGSVCFANPAAESRLGVRSGDAAREVLPADVLADPAEHFIASVRLAGQTAAVTAARTEDLALYTVRLPGGEAAASPVPDRALGELGSDLLSARLAIDALVTAGTAADEKSRAYAQVLYRSYYRMKRLHDHLMLENALRRHSLPFSPRLVDLRELCAELCDTVSALVEGMGVKLTFTAEEGDYRASADRPLLETLLLNLLSNSLLHAGEDGRIHVSLASRDRRFVLAVDDPGAGIPARRLAELFAGGGAPDATDTAAGAGLGLLLVRGIAEMHGGSFILESRENGGTRTRVWLPCPSPEELLRLRQPDVPYRADGLNTVLTELSTVLDRSFYDRKVFD